MKSKLVTALVPAALFAMSLAATAAPNSNQASSNAPRTIEEQPGLVRNATRPPVHQTRLLAASPRSLEMHPESTRSVVVQRGGGTLNAGISHQALLAAPRTVETLRGMVVAGKATTASALNASR